MYVYIRGVVQKQVSRAGTCSDIQQYLSNKLDMYVYIRGVVQKPVSRAGTSSYIPQYLSNKLDRYVRVYQGCCAEAGIKGRDK